MGDQEPRSRRGAIEVRKAEQTGAKTEGNRHLVAEDLSGWQAAKAPWHPHPRRCRRDLAPGANTVSGTGAPGHGTTMTGMIQHLLSPGLRER
jgi:hypothetical protein